MRRTTRGLPQPFEKRVKILEKHVLKNKTIVNVPRRCGVGLAWSEARPRGQEVRHGVRLDLALEPPLRWSCRCGHRDQADQFVGEGFCCKKVILLIMGYLPFRNLIKFSQVHDEIMIFEDSPANLSGDEGIVANRICFS